MTDMHTVSLTFTAQGKTITTGTTSPAWTWAMQVGRRKRIDAQSMAQLWFDIASDIVNAAEWTQ